MRLDRFARAVRRRSPKVRTLGLVAQVALLYRSRRVVVALVIIGLDAWMGYDSFVRKGQRLSDLFGGPEGSATDVQAIVILAAAAALVALLLLVSGIRRLLQAIAVIEYGTAATATVRAVQGRTQRHRQTYFHTWVATCRFSTASGESATLEVIAPTKDSLVTGDRIAVLYDPDRAEHALAVAALPAFVRTNPPLEKTPSPEGETPP